MRITYNIAQIQRIVDDIHAITDISIAVMDTKYNIILREREKKNDIFCRKIQETDIGILKCQHSDIDILKRCAEEKRPITHICHAGVLDTAVPIFKNRILVGFIVLGRVRLKSNSVNIRERLEWTGDPVQFERHYKKLTCLSEQQLSSLIHLLSYLLFENAIEIKYDELIDFASDYIEHNLSDDLTVFALCKKLNTSKNPLYRSFRDTYHCTVNEYVTARRMERAKELLCHTDEEIVLIAQLVGYDNYTYFCKLFKRRAGVSPSGYRKNMRQAKEESQHTNSLL